MQKHWLIQKGNAELIVFALGWSGVPGAVADVLPAGYDVLCLYDYRTLEPLTRADTAAYRDTFLFAWSFGVWAAEQVCRDIPLTRAIALNGTPFPVSDQYGIPCRSFLLTLRKIRKAGLDVFNRRAYGPYYTRVERRLADRPDEEKFDELEFLSDASRKPYTPGLEWERAVIGDRDAIFPPAHMAAYWGRKAVVRDGMPHYPFGHPETITEFLPSKISHDNR